MPVTQKLGASATFLLLTLLVYFALTQRFPVSGDDYSYLYQAKLFAAGKLYAEDPLYDEALPFYECVETNHLRGDHGHRFSQYPPGWPALLALGVKLRVPWLVDPLLGAALMFVMLEYTERRMGRDLVKVTCLLLMLCFFFCYYAASFRPHIATAVFVFTAFLLYDVAERRPERSKLRLFVAGALLGYSAMIRYVDWIPLSIWISASLVRRKRLVGLTLFGIGFGLLASGNLIYNGLLSGHPLQVPATADRLMASWRGFLVTMVRLGNLLWTFPPVLLLMILWRRYQASSRAKMYIALFSMNVAVYFFYSRASGGPGPRYFLAYFPFLVLAVVDLCRWIYDDSLPATRRLWTFTVLTLVVCSLVFAAKEAYKMYWRRELDRLVRHIGGGRNILLLKTGTYATDLGDLTRNPPVLSSADNLYFTYCNEPGRAALLKRFPGRRVFVYEYPGRLYPYELTNE